MSEHERKRRLVKARSELARVMFELKQVKDHVSASEYRQIAEIIVEIGHIRDRIEKIEQ